MLESYSAEALRTVSLATAEARRLKHPRVGTEHLLLGLLADGDTATARALNAAGATIAAARHKVAEASGTESGEPPIGGPQFTPRARRALERAGRFARQEREPEVRTGHLLLGVLDVEGLACQVLRGLGVDLVRLRESVVGPPAETVPAIVEPSAPPPTVRPRCPACAAALDDTLLATAMPARRDGDSGSATVNVIYCGACGTALGALPSLD